MMDNYIASYDEKMGKTIQALKGDLAAVRAGRANPAVLNKIIVDYYGTPTPINQMAALSVAEARVLVIQPWDAKSITTIEKAIQASDIGINPTNDGRVIRLVFPQLTEERRKELVREIKNTGENSKVAVRSIRREAIEQFKKLKKANELTEDDQTDLEKEIQQLTDKKIKEIDELISDKEKEVLEI